jgi:very-short-patch-repair endonuclease
MVVDVAEAGQRGITRAQLLGKKWQRIQPRMYAARDVANDPLVKLRAAARRLPDVAAFSGPSAAWLLGLDPLAPSAIEATISPPCPVAHLVGIKIRRSRLSPDEVVIRRGLRVTSLVRTAADLACRLDLVEAVVVLDAAMHRGLKHAQLVGWALAHPRHRGVARLRRAIELAEPKAESAMETRLRLALQLAGLPRPQAQVWLPDAQARADLYYPDHRLVIEYSATHRDSLAADNRRQNRLMNAGYRVLRFTASDLSGDVAGTVRRALS